MLVDVLETCVYFQRPRIAPIATEHNNVGVFANDPQLLAMIQWASASIGGTTHLTYYTLNNAQLDEVTAKYYFL